MTLLVTGGAGFIGSNFLYRTAEREPETRLVCVDKLTYAANPATLAPLIEQGLVRFYRTDVCDRGAVFSVFEETRPDAVVHFAAESHVDRSIADPSVFLKTNVTGTGVLLDACRAFGVVRFHQISTDEVYGDLPLTGGDPFTEASPLRPGSPYAASKAAADLLALSYARTYGLPVTVSRCSNNYGRFQNPEKLIPRMIARALAGKTLPVYGTGKNVRDWLHVTDHCDAVRLILRRGVPGEIYNVGGGFEIDNLSLVKRLCRLLDAPETLIGFVPDRRGHDLRYAVDAKKLRSLGWEPETDFETGLKETVLWYLNNRDWWTPLQEQADQGSL